MKRLVLWLLAGAVTFGLGCQPAVQSPGQEKAAEVRTPHQPPLDLDDLPAKRVRQAAVAGLFYPNDQSALAKAVDRYLGDVKPAPIKNLRALVCPHAGYEYSGPVAAVAYKQLQGRDIETAIVLAPSHYARFVGAVIPEVEAFETPLGRIRISPKAARLAKSPPFTAKTEWEVLRPDWWQRSPMELPAFGEDTPHTWEHSLEVQLPFLQRTLKRFTLIPVVFGEVDPERAAKALAEYLDDKTILIASSDLSHYRPYREAIHVDSSCTGAICALDVKWMEKEDACGKTPILTVMHLARAKGWKARLLDYRNSGDTAGDKSHVVGYAAIAFYVPDETKPAEPAAKEPSKPTANLYTPEERKLLLDLARKTVVAAAKRTRLPEVDAAKVSEKLRQRRACFVTLTRQGDLRGCIGSIFPAEPLCEAVVGRAASAATDDPRFAPVEPSELDQVHIEISVLTVPQRLEFSSPEDLLEKLRPNVDGVVLRVAGREATFLPQVWEQLPDQEAYLGHLSQKAGLSPTAWRRPEAMVLTYQVEAFAE